MSDTSQGPGWWQASDGSWYSPEQHPDFAPATQGNLSATAPIQAESPPSITAPPMPSVAPYPQAVAPMGYPVAPQNQKTNGMAVASLVLGIVWVAGIGAVLAVIFGFVSRKKIAASQGQETGGGLAIAGIVLGIIGIVGALGFWISLFALGAAVDSGVSYANGYSYGVSNYSATGNEATVCSSANVASGDNTSSWISGCQSAWSSEQNTGANGTSGT